MCTTNMPSDFKDQKKVSNSLGCQFKLPCGCWEQNSGTLQMQPVFLAANLPLQPFNDGQNENSKILMVLKDTLNYL